MCQASTCSHSTRRNRRAIRPTGDDHAAKLNGEAKHLALHKERTRAARKESIRVSGNILDDYAVFDKVLGNGNYGCVRECLHRSTSMPYACKSVDKSKIRRLDHLKNEVELMSAIDHPNIVKMVDCYEGRQYVHIVTERCTGGELFDRIAEHTTKTGCFSEEKSAAIVKALLEAVAYLHEMDIAHRDIKPENILFETEEENVVKLIDFGLSRRHKKGESPMVNPVGTAYYMAPEVLRCKYDKSCDLWSVGTILYILLCGYPPFNGDTDPDIFENIKRGKFELPERQWADKSDEVKDLIRCLLRKDPKKRFTAHEALRHPWIMNLGRKPEKKGRRRSSVQVALRKFMTL